MAWFVSRRNCPSCLTANTVAGPILLQRCLHLAVSCIVLGQPVAGRGGLTVPLDGVGAVPGLVDQFE